jgi:hypothetical protein
VSGTVQLRVGEFTPWPFDISFVVAGHVTPELPFCTAAAGMLAKLPDVPNRYWNVTPLYVVALHGLPQPPVSWAWRLKVAEVWPSF